MSFFGAAYTAEDPLEALEQVRDQLLWDDRSFPKFLELPKELRNKIWLEAFLEATHDRNIVLNGVFNGVPPPGEVVSGGATASRLWSLERQTIRVGLHLYSPAATHLQLACRESREEYCHVFDVDLRVYGRLPTPMDVWYMSGGMELIRASKGAKWPRRRGNVRVSTKYDLFTFHNELHMPTFIQGIGKREHFMHRTFPVVAGPMSPAQIASIKHAVVVNWGPLPHYWGHLQYYRRNNQDFLDDAEAAMNDPVLDGLLAGVLSREDHYLEAGAYTALQMRESRGTCFASDLAISHPGHSRLRFPQRAPQPAVEQAKEEEEEAGH
ncbi:hypothetical protein PG996_008212 [Apiospora saccharicola]|uniref:2EXR domain-containing protein n=1 Tax=Apiospora saccharicola TaxID=335842 RepID=A0ABR1UZT2_9PEZI